MNLKKKKKVIHDLNNLAQQVVFKGDQKFFYTCPRVNNIFREYNIKTFAYGVIVSKTCNDYNVGYKSETIFSERYIMASGEILKNIRLDAIKELVNQIRNLKHDHLFI